METEKPQSGSAIERAKEYGIDLTLNQSILKQTPTERVLALQNMMRLVDEARKANTVLYSGKTA
ncbi:MAG: hypothetical protein HY960_02930 [Ignavibacteriae bacterium]|nr:hypothetical protein [Ignavibacteriota bacterium]